MKRLLLIAPLLALAVACGQAPKVEIKQPTTLSTVELALNGNLTTQVAPTTLSDESQLVFTKTAFDLITDTKRNTRYISATFSVQNNTGNPLNNLTLYALNKVGNLGGTAIKNLQNFAGSGLSDANYARAAQPGHKMNSSAGAAATVNANNANLQLLSTLEAASVSSANGTVLEYGFKTNESVILVGGTGTLTVSYRLPSAAAAVDATQFTATFVATTDATNRVSQSAEENAAATSARATSGGEIVFLGPKSQDQTNVPTPSGVTPIRLTNAKTAVGPDAYLLSEYAFASFLSGSDLAEGPYVYSEGYDTAQGNFACASASGCTLTQGFTANGYNAVITSTGNATGGAKIIARPFNFNPQNLSKYKKLKIFARVSSGTSANLDIETNSNIGLRYPLTISDTLGEITVDLTQPQCAPTCTPANIATALSSVKGAILERFAGGGTTLTLEMGNIVFFDFQP